jgi:hypothetical protein
MRRAGRLVLLPSVLAVTLWVGTASAPSGSVACSCAGARPGIFDGRESVVLMGTVGAHLELGRYTFEVERWFTGGDAPTVLLQSASVPQGGGVVAFNTCGLDLEPGSHLILAAQAVDGVLDPSTCSPHSNVDSPEGQAMVAAARATFGEGLVPGQPPPTRDAPSIDLATIAILAVLGFLGTVVTGVVISAVGRRERPTTPVP